MTTFGYPLLKEIARDGHERTKNGRKGKPKQVKGQRTEGKENQKKEIRFKTFSCIYLVIYAYFKACASITGEI